MISRFILRSVLIVVFNAMLVARGIADEPTDLRLARLPSADQLPFSFEFGGKNSNDFLKQWKHSSRQGEENEHFKKSIDVWTDPTTKLEMRREETRYTKYPVVEWTLYFTNTGNKPVPALKNVWALDHRIAANGSRALPVHHWSGSMTLPNDFEPTVTFLGQNQGPARAGGPDALVFKGKAGKPSWNTLPYFNIELTSAYHNFEFARDVPAIEAQQEKTGGVLVSVGWPGQWIAEFSAPTASELRMVAGQEYLNVELQPGESIRTPLITLLSYGGNAAAGQNVWRRWMLEHNVPRLAEGKPFTPHINAGSSYQFGAMEKATVENQTMFIERYLKQGIPIQYWWMDAGWYPSATESWTGVGTWEVDRNRFPNGLRPISEFAHARGVETILWFEPERVYRGTDLYKNHPEWLLPYDTERLAGMLDGAVSSKPQDSVLLDLGNPQAWKWVVERVSKIMKEDKIDVYRQDFNIAPLPFWLSNDQPQRVGYTENQYVKGYLAFWDELRRRFPGLLIDTCASGGMRNDLETLRRSVPLLRSDYILEATSNQNQTYGIASWMPLHGAGIKQHDPYGFWSNATPALHLHYEMRTPQEIALAEKPSSHTRVARPEDQDLGQVARMVKLWENVVAPCYWGDYYPLTPWSASDDVWLAWQYNLEAENRGVVQAFRRTNSAEDVRRFRLRGLDPNARYEVSVYSDDCDVSKKHVMSGRYLMDSGISVTVKAQPGVTNIAYARVKGV